MNLSDKIKQWATDRNLHTADPSKQMLKLMEEAGELAESIAKDDRVEQIDAIGDINVVLEVLCLQLGLDFDGCKQSAYNEIKDRKGKMINGVFIKESDLN